jgi:hypothetical protein
VKLAAQGFVHSGFDGSSRSASRRTSLEAAVAVALLGARPAHAVAKTAGIIHAVHVTNQCRPMWIFILCLGTG